MSEQFTQITVLDAASILERQESGLIIPMHSDAGLEVVDCSDDRSLTADYYLQRTEQYGHEVSPGRYFGAASGIAVASLITFAAENGETAVTRFIDDFSPEGFVDYAANLSDRAHKLPGGSVELNQHSDDSKEQNTIELGDHKDRDDPLGCKFATALGAVLLGADKNGQVAEAQNVLSAVGSDLPVNEAADGIRILQKYIPGDFGIHRGALHYSQTRTARHTPVAIHEGQHAPNQDAHLTVDLAGYRSNANRHNDAGLYRYHHTPNLAVELISKLIPEIKLDPRLLEATGLLLGASTRLALSGAQAPTDLRIEVIPAEFRVAA